MRKALLFSALFCLCFSALSLADSITSGSYTISNDHSEGGTISGQDFSFTQPATIDANFLVFNAPPGTQINLSNLTNFLAPIGFYMQATYASVCASGGFGSFVSSYGTYDGITPTCLTGGLNYSAVLTVAPDGLSATGPFTASGSVQGWVIAPGGDQTGPFTKVFDVPLTGQGTLELTDGPLYFPGDTLPVAYFTFTTPESSTMLLMAIGLAMALGQARASLVGLAAQKAHGWATSKDVIARKIEKHL